MTIRSSTSAQRWTNRERLDKEQDSRNDDPDVKVSRTINFRRAYFQPVMRLVRVDTASASAVAAKNRCVKRWIGATLQISFRSIDLSISRLWQSAECRFRRACVVVHLALLFRNLACGWTKFRGCSGDCVLHEQIVIQSLPAKCYQKNKGLVSTSSRCIENTEPVLSSSRP
jgi:hypothetical protein